MPVVTQSVQLALVLLPCGDLGEPGPHLDLRPGPHDRPFFERPELGPSPLFVERAPRSLRVLGAQPRLLGLLPSPQLVDATLLGRPRALLGLSPLSLFAGVRFPQELLDGDPDRRFLPLRHGDPPTCLAIGQRPRRNVPPWMNLTTMRSCWPRSSPGGSPAPDPPHSEQTPHSLDAEGAAQSRARRDSSRTSSAPWTQSAPCFGPKMCS